MDILQTMSCVNNVIQDLKSLKAVTAEIIKQEPNAKRREQAP